MPALKKIAAVTALLWGIAACQPAATISDDDDLAAALDVISVENLQAHLEFLASDALEGRDSGEPGYDKAAAYVADQFAQLGLEPGGTDGWYQSVNLRTYSVDTETPRAVIYRGEDAIELAYRDDFSIGADAIREQRAVKAEVVYAGHGVHAPEHGYDDFAGIDVNGKILAIFSGAPEVIEGAERAYHASSRTKRKAAVERGAVGFVSLLTPRQEERRAWDDSKDRIGARPSMTWVSDDGRAAGYFTELLGSANLTLAASERLFGRSPLSFEQALEANSEGRVASAATGSTISLSVRTVHENIKSPNVIGVVRGTDPRLADEYVVYTAHLDHIGIRDNHTDDNDALYNGAYDNAMGVALMLETARALAAAPPRRSVMFIALTAEERGLLGSDYFVNNPTVPVESLVANVNLDMPLFLFPVADLVAFGSEHSSLQSVVDQAAADEQFVLSPDPLPEENLFIRSDQYSFVRVGIPAVYLIPGFTSSNDDIDGEAMFRDHLKNHYHKPSDDLSRPVDWDSALRFARANARIGFDIGQDKRRPTWNEGDFFGETFAR